MSLQPCRLEASDECFIAAPPHRVWQLLRRIEQWPQWNRHVRVLSVRSRINPMHFCWKVSGIRLHSDITADRPTRTLQWKSVGRGILARRSWMLIPEAGGTRVITHAELEGLAVCIRPIATQRLLRLRTHQVLVELRNAAESAHSSVRMN
ncbi:MAG: SRPBCC family protein [Chlorobi bacterium]|nr:SRPBCC family protein [Chlorobiota bacterium]